MDKDKIKLLESNFKLSATHTKPNSMNKAKTKALMVMYFNHIDVMERLDEVNPSWSFISDNISWNDTYNWKGEITGKECAINGYLQLFGIKRYNIGIGRDPKNAITDLLKRCAMSFGIGRYLYKQDQIWVNWDDKSMKYKKFMARDIPYLFNNNKIPSKYITNENVIKLNKIIDTLCKKSNKIDYNKLINLCLNFSNAFTMFKLLQNIEVISDAHALKLIDSFNKALNDKKELDNLISKVGK